MNRFGALIEKNTGAHRASVYIMFHRAVSTITKRRIMTNGSNSYDYRAERERKIDIAPELRPE
jgi:hypothetical protein